MNVQPMHRDRFRGDPGSRGDGFHRQCSLVKTRRDKFNDAVGKEGSERSVRNMVAIISLLDINSELKGIQDRYEAKVRSEYGAVISNANAANKAFEDALKIHITAGPTTEGKV